MTMKIAKDNRTKIKEILQLTGGFIWTLETLYGSDTLDGRLEMLRGLELGTVGREIADVMDRHGFRLIPKFESHDLKHVILDYGMTRREEIRMQAYLLGNGNYTLPCVGFLSIGLFYPSIWADLIMQYKRGSKAKSIFSLTLDECMYCDLNEVRAEYASQHVGSVQLA